MKLYTSNYLSQSLSIIDCKQLKLEKEIKLGTDIYPHHFYIEENEKIAYIPSSFDGVLYVLDIKNEKIIESVSIGGNLSQVVVCNNELFIANEDSNSIYVIDKYSLEPVGIITVENMPHGFAYDEIENKLYVPCINSIVCVDVERKIVEKKMDFEYKSWHIKIDKYKGRLYASTLDGKILILDKKTLEIVGIIDGFLIPVEICINYNKNNVYVADLGYKSIKVLNYINNKEIKTVTIDGFPQGLELSNDGKLLFLTDTFNNSVKVFRTDINELIKEIRVGKEPTTIIYK